MDLQQVTAVPPRPLASLAEDYGAAVLHLAWGLDRRSGLRSMLFACVELLPHELPPPLDDGPQRFALDKSGDRVLLVRHAIGTAEAALAWYLRTRRGEAAALLHGEDDEQDAAVASEGTDLLEIALLGEEPVWPNLVCVTEGVPFTPAGSDGTRAHHLVPIAPVEPSALWPDLVSEEREAAIEWLSHRLHFSLERYPEYLGSANLVAANPVIRELDSRLYRQGPPDESVLFRLIPRHGKTLDGLWLSVSLSRPTGEQRTESIRPQSPVIEVHVPGGVDLIGHVLADDSRGVLSIHPRAVFLRGFGVRNSAATSQAGSSFDRAGSPRSQEDEAPAQRALSRMRQTMNHRRERIAAEAQLSLRGDALAVTTVQSLLLRASRDICVVDAMFSAHDLSGLTAAVASSLVSLRILVPPSSSGDAEPESRRLAALASGLEGARSRRMPARSSSPILVRLMREEAPWGTGSLLLIDNAVWLLSGHMKDVGVRSMVLVQLPAPAEVKDAVNRAFEEGIPLDIWLQTHALDTQWAAQ